MNSKKKKPRKLSRKVKKFSKMGIVCHRGASSQYPENTYSAIKACLAYGNAGSELDIQLTKDNKIIALHDTTLERTSIGTMPDVNISKSEYNKIIKKPVWELTYNEIKKINIGKEFKHECTPLLTDLLNLITDKPKVSFAKSSFFLVIEIAGATSDKISDFNILQHLKKLLIKYSSKNNNVIKKLKFISFGPDILRLLWNDNFFKKFERYWVLESRDFDINKSRYNASAVKYPNGGINENLAIKGISGFIEFAKKSDLNLTGLDLESEMSESFIRNVKKIKNSGLKVITWVHKHPVQAINDGEKIAKFQDKIGVDYFTSNIPNTLLYIMNSNNRR